MRIQELNHTTFAVLTVGLAVGALVPGCQTSGGNKQVPPEQLKRFEVMRAKGTQASLTVFPVAVGDDASFNRDVASVMALLLEKAGMANLRLTNTEFRLPKEATFDQATELFGEFIRENPIETDYALYAEFVGNPQTGPTEIRGIIVDKSGRSVWVDRQTQADRDFERDMPSDPMICCHFLAERMRSRLGIPKSARDESGQGEIARMFARDAPAPGKAERAAMERRRAVMKEAGRKVRLAVFPVRLADDEVGKHDAAHLAKLLSEKRVCEASDVDSPLRVTIESVRNEQKLLWDLARAFQDHLRRNPPEADYVLLADYIMHGGRAWAVHFVVCDRSGEWVIVDFQNDHHGDFQCIDPKTLDDCGHLVAKRLKGYLR